MASRLMQRLLGNQLLTNMSWLGMAQFLTRISRLLSTIVVARILTPEHYGLAAIVLVVNEFAHVFARAGTASRIVQATEKELSTIANTAYYLNWGIGGTLFVVQCLIAFPMALWYDNDALILPVCVLALSYLMLPTAMVHAALNIRANRLNVVARSEVRQAIGDGVLTVLFALAGFGMWALVLPKVLVIPLWIMTHRKAVTWKAPSRPTFSAAGDILTYTKRVLGVDLLGAFRANIDYILVGYFLGVTSLGIYYFAYNAGLGITRGLINGMNNALFPYLCATDDKEQLKKRFRFGLKALALSMCPLILAQAALAPIYVPWVFGARWVEDGAVPILMLVCLSGIPIAFSEAGSQFLRAIGRPQDDLQWHCLFTLVFVSAIGLGLSFGIVGVAAAVLLVQVFMVPVYYFIQIKPKIDAEVFSEDDVVYKGV